MLSISTRLAQLLKNENLTDDQRQDIVNTANYSKDVVSDIRRISHDLHPAALDHLGLTGALKELTRNAGLATGIDIGLNMDAKNDQFSKKQALQLFRIVQELITNVAKHSQATNVSVDLNVHRNDCILNVSDNGGTVQSVNKPSPGIGSQILTQRASILQGSIKFSNTHTGTKVHLWFPLNPPQEDPS